MRTWGTTEHDMAVLTRGGWLSRHPEAFRAEVLRRGRIEVFAPGEAVYRIGDPPGGIYGLVWGIAAVTAAPTATPRLLHIGASGFWTGEAPYMIGGGRMISLRAVTECRTLHLPLDAMEAMTAADPQVARRFGQIPLLNIALMLQVIDGLLIKNPSRRIGAVLLRIADAGGTIPVTQAEIGDMACATRKQVNLALNRFDAAGWTARGYREVRLLDAAGLRAFLATADEG